MNVAAVSAIAGSTVPNDIENCRKISAVPNLLISLSYAWFFVTTV